MADIFLIHVEEDADTALSLSSYIEDAGFSTWYYERDTVPGVSYLLQVSHAIDNAQAVVLLISKASLGSHQVTTEVVRAHEAAKPILPVLIDVTHVEFQRRQPQWRFAVGAATSISLHHRDLTNVSHALVDGLYQLGIQPGNASLPSTLLPIVTSSSPEPIDIQPYPGFHDSFRDLVTAQRAAETGAILHIVFGSIAAIRAIPVVIPVGQAFDFEQRNPRSVLGSFENLYVDGRPFFEDLRERWSPSTRPTAAGLGECMYLELPQNTRNLPGVLFVVTTRDLSTSKDHYGLYANTPIEGIELILDSVIANATANKLPALAIPLLGTGFANIRRTLDHTKLGQLLRQAVTLLSVEKLQKNLGLETSSLRRAVLVIYSQNPQSEEEHALWETVVRFLGSRSGRNQQMEHIVKEIKTLCTQR